MLGMEGKDVYTLQRDKLNSSHTNPFVFWIRSDRARHTLPSEAQTTISTLTDPEMYRRFVFDMIRVFSNVK